MTERKFFFGTFVAQYILCLFVKVTVPLMGGGGGCKGAGGGITKANGPMGRSGCRWVTSGRRRNVENRCRSFCWQPHPPAFAAVVRNTLIPVQAFGPRGQSPSVDWMARGQHQRHRKPGQAPARAPSRPALEEGEEHCHVWLQGEKAPRGQASASPSLALPQRHISAPLLTQSRLSEKAQPPTQGHGYGGGRGVIWRDPP